MADQAEMMQQVDITPDRSKRRQRKASAGLLGKLTPWWKSGPNVYSSSSDEEFSESTEEDDNDDTDGHLRKWVVSDNQICEVSRKSENVKREREEDEPQIHRPEVKEEFENTCTTGSHHPSNDVNFPNHGHGMSVESLKFEENDQSFEGYEHATEHTNIDEIQNDRVTKLTSDTRRTRQRTVYHSRSRYVFGSSSDEDAVVTIKDEDFDSREETETSDNSESGDDTDTDTVEKVNEVKDKEEEALEKLFKYKEHMEIGTDIHNKCFYKCKICQLYYCKTASRMLCHLNKHDEGKLKCEQCQFNASSESSLQKHKEDHTQAIQKCDMCEYTTQRIKLLKNHKIQVHTKEEDKKFICPSEGCRKRFATKSNLQSHMCSHNKAILCQFCGKTYTFRKDLRKHISREHDINAKRKKIYCDVCGKGYIAGNKGALRRHKMQHHLNERPFKCKYCPKAFVDQVRQIFHERTHTGEKPYKCKFCDFRAAKPSQVESHSRRHTGRKPYKCKECSYASTWNVQLKSHMKAHSSDTAMRCDICNVVFINERSLKGHNKKFAVTHDGLSKSSSLLPSVQI
ncbi:zinc finger protein 808-like isoform X2 [Ptychodera flava]